MGRIICSKGTNLGGIMKKITKQIYLSLYLAILNVSLYPNLNETRIVVTSIPKSGTNLLARCISLLTGKQLQVNFRPLYENYGSKATWHGPNSALWNTLPANSFYLSHIVYNEQAKQELIFYNYKHLFIYRDPRDQIVSYYYWSRHWPNVIDVHNNDYEFYLYYLITNGNVISGCTKGIAEFYQCYLPWINEPTCYAVKFEDLIGPQGGGNLNTQLHEIKNIANFIGISISDQEALSVANQLFGSTGTFRSGQIGEWKTHFNAHHKMAFKEVAGTLLIELGYEKDLNW